MNPTRAWIPAPQTTAPALTTWGRIPRTYIRLTKDMSMLLALQDRFIAEAATLIPDNPFDVRSVESSHVGLLIRPHQATTILAGLAGPQ